MADPGFSGGTSFKGVREKLLLGQFSTENCMKMKEIGPRGERGVPSIRQCKGFVQKIDLLSFPQRKRTVIDTSRFVQILRNEKLRDKYKKPKIF